MPRKKINVIDKFEFCVKCQVNKISYVYSAAYYLNLLLSNEFLCSDKSVK